MGKIRRNVEIRVDVYTRCCLTVIAVLLSVLIVALWAQPLPVSGQAVAAPGGGIPDSGRQRETMIKELKKNTTKLEDLTKLFQSGKAKVQVVQDDKTSGR